MKNIVTSQSALQAEIIRAMAQKGHAITPELREKIQRDFPLVFEVMGLEGGQTSFDLWSQDQRQALLQQSLEIQRQRAAAAPTQEQVRAREWAQLRSNQELLVALAELKEAQNEEKERAKEQAREAFKQRQAAKAAAAEKAAAAKAAKAALEADYADLLATYGGGC